MNAWDHAIAFTLRWEGGLVDDPNDRGRRTRFGISSRAHPDVGLETLTQERAQQLYYERYWLPVRGPELPPALAMALFDFAVHSGPGRAVKALQRVLGVTPVLGHFGAVTMGAVDAVVDPLGLAVELTMARADFLGDLAEADPSQVPFIGGWVSRLVDLTATVCRLEP